MELLNEIWNNWMYCEGNCKLCPSRDANLYWYPFYGMGDTKSDVMIVAHNPAYNIRGMHKRFKLNYDVKQSPDKYFENVRTKWLNERKSSLDNMLNKVISIMTASTKYNIDNIYFTNIKKCGNFSGEATDSGVVSCCSYLFKEIDAIKPRLVIAFGNDAIRYIIQYYFDIDVKSVDKYHKKILYGKLDGKLVKFLFLLHWGYAMRKSNFGLYSQDINLAFKEAIKRNNLESFGGT